MPDLNEAESFHMVELHAPDRTQHIILMQLSKLREIAESINNVTYPFELNIIQFS